MAPFLLLESPFSLPQTSPLYWLIKNTRIIQA
jgi:hypothetical protein